MQRINVKRGLDLPINGAPVQEISDTAEPSSVAVLGPDYEGMKPTMVVNVGDRVREGQLLFEDKKTPGVRYTSPGCGTIAGCASTRTNTTSRFRKCWRTPRRVNGCWWR